MTAATGNIFVHTDDRERLIEWLSQRHGPKWSVSEPADEWIVIVPALESVSEHLAQELSADLSTTVITAETRSDENESTSGYAVFENGEITEFHEPVPDKRPRAAIDQLLKQYAIPHRPVAYLDTLSDTRFLTISGD